MLREPTWPQSSAKKCCKHVIHSPGRGPAASSAVTASSAAADATWPMEGCRLCPWEAGSRMPGLCARMELSSATRGRAGGLLLAENGPAEVSTTSDPVVAQCIVSSQQPWPDVPPLHSSQVGCDDSCVAMEHCTAVSTQSWESRLGNLMAIGKCSAETWCHRGWTTCQNELLVVLSLTTARAIIRPGAGVKPHLL